MSEDLNQMVQDGTEPAQQFSENDLTLPEAEMPVAEEEEVVAAAEETEVAPDNEAAPQIRATVLTDWFEEHVDSFPDISAVRLQIRGVDPRKTLVVTVADPSGETDDQDNPKRNLEFIKNADTQPVLDIAPTVMDIYSNGFRIMYPSERGSIKCYGTKTGLEVIFCESMGGFDIPYAIAKMKKADDGIDIIEPPEVTDGWLNEPADREALTIAYRQASKIIETINTNNDVVAFLCGRQAEIRDINHHIQIDKVLMTLQGIQY